MKKFKVKRNGGQWDISARNEFRENFKGMDDGMYEIVITKADKKFSPSRYKYYFDYVMFVILMQAGDFLKVFTRDGNVKPVQSTQDVHAIMKATFNPITFVDIATGLTGTIGGTTTDLSDRDFIGKYIEMIIEKFSSEPYYCDLTLTFDDWKYFHQSGDWHKVKELIKENKELTLENIKEERV